MKFYKIVLSDGPDVQEAGWKKFAPLDEEYAKTIAATVEAEAAEWRLCVNNKWMHADDLHDTKETSSSHSNKGFDSSVVKGYLVNNGHFAGVVLLLEFSHGGGMSSYRDKYYCILHTNGNIDGKNEAGSSFTGEDSDSEDIDTYTIENIYGKKPIEKVRQKADGFLFEVSGEYVGTCTIVGVEIESLKCLKIPEALAGYTVRAIASSVFEGREDIESLEIPDCVEEIGEKAFANCTKMRSLKIGEGLCVVGENRAPYGKTGAFVGCSGLEKIKVAPKNKHFRSDGNCLIKIDRPKDYCGIVLNRDALILGCCNTDISKVKIIHAIECFAFYGCEGLKAIDIPKMVQRVGCCAFENCTGLERVTLFEGTRDYPQICSDAFTGCSSLSYVWLAKGLRWLEEDSFDDCPALKEICYGGTEEDWENVTEGYGCRPHFDTPVLYEQPKKD